MKTILPTSAVCLLCFFSADLLYGYHPISPYAYTLNNPVRFIDPDGRDVWGIDHNGNIIRRIEDTTQDAFYIIHQVDGEWRRMEGEMYSVSFEYGTVKNVIETTYNIGGNTYDLTLFNLSGDGNAQKLMETMSNNHNNIEWSHSKVGTSKSGNGFVSTSHLEGREASSLYIINNGYTIREHTHNHPFTPHPSPSDLEFHSNLNNGRKVPTYIYYNNGKNEPRYLQYNGTGIIYPTTIHMNNGVPTVQFHNRQRITPWQRR